MNADFDQVYLLPPQIEDWVGPDHPARFIREVVEALDLKELGFTVDVAGQGRPPYAADLLVAGVAVWVLGACAKLSEVGGCLSESYGFDLVMRDATASCSMTFPGTPHPHGFGF